MGLLKMILCLLKGNSKSNESPQSQTTPESQVTYESRATYESQTAYESQTPNHYHELSQSDICDGMVFQPTLKLSTPLWILKKFGEVHKGTSIPPNYGDMRYGVWNPKLNSDFAIFDEIFDKGATSASDAGPIDPKKYIQYAIGLLEIFESDKSIHEKMKLATCYAKNNDDHQYIEQKICWFYNEKDICEVMFRFISFDEKVAYARNKKGYLKLVDGVTKSIASELEKVGVFTIDQLIKLSENELLEIKGIGKKTASKICSALQKLNSIRSTNTP